MNISLKQFLETGRLGDLRLGISIERVHTLLGKPDSVDGVSRKHPWPSIYIYVNVEIFFSRGMSPLCRGIEWQAGRGPFHLRSMDTVEDWSLMLGARRPAVEAYLKGTGLVLEDYSSDTPKRESLLLRSGVVLDFNKDGVLHSVSAWEGAMITAARWISR